MYILPDPDPLARGMDPDPALDPDPSIIMKKNNKKNPDPILWHFLTVYLWKIMYMYLQKSNKQKKLCWKINFFAGIFKVNDENSRIRIREPLVRVMDPPHQNVMDPGHR